MNIAQNIEASGHTFEDSVDPGKGPESDLTLSGVAHLLDLPRKAVEGGSDEAWVISGHPHFDHATPNEVGIV